MRKLKGLEDVITVDVVDWLLEKPQGWKFTEEKDGCTPDSVNNCQFLSEVCNGYWTPRKNGFELINFYSVNE